MKRVVVTGLGVISSLGNDINTFWNNIKEGKNGISELTSFDNSNFDVKLASEVKSLDLSILPKRDVKFDSKYINYARIASKEAYKNSNLENSSFDKNKFGVYISTSLGGGERIEEGINRINEKKRVSPYLLQSILPNMASGKVAIDLNAKGSNMAHVAACTSGATSIGEAYLKIKYGYEDIIIAGASDSSITPLTVSCFSSMGAIYKGNNKTRASIPFDKERSGFVIGEGCGILVLEEKEHAIKRNAHIYAEIVGYGCNNDASNIVSPDFEGLSCKYAMKKALDDANISPEEIDYINAHGTSTHLNDLYETQAIKTALGEASKKVMVSSTKGNTGHLLGAAGGVEAIACIKALENDFVPPTINYKVPDEECDLDIVPNKGRNVKLKYAMSNSLGFGGHNSSVIFKKYEE